MLLVKLAPREESSDPLLQFGAMHESNPTLRSSLDFPFPREPLLTSGPPGTNGTATVPWQAIEGQPSVAAQSGCRSASAITSLQHEQAPHGKELSWVACLPSKEFK